MAIEYHRLVFLSVDINDFFSLGDRSQWLVRDLQCFERFGRGGKFAETAVDEDQAGEWLLLIAQALVAACVYLPHRNENIPALPCAHDGFSVFCIILLPVFPDDHS